MQGDGIYRDYDPTIRKSINFGYIIVPDGVDRDKFIESCLRYERFSVQVEGGGGVLHNCYATKSAIRDIRFPINTEIFGSPVIFFTEPFGGKSVIVGVLNPEDDTDINKSDTTIIKRKIAGNCAILTVDGNGQINIDVIGTSEKGKVNINVRNDTLSAEVNINVKGNINLMTEGDINLTAESGNVNIVTDGVVDIKAQGEVNIETVQDCNIDSEKFNLHKADQAMIRGDELQEQIDKTNDVVEAIKNSLDSWSPTPNDGGAALKAVYISNIIGKVMGDFSDIKSEKSFLE